MITIWNDRHELGRQREQTHVMRYHRVDGDREVGILHARARLLDDDVKGLQSLQGRRTASEAVRGLLSLASENRFPERGEGAARDSVRMRQRPVCRQEFPAELGTMVMQ